MTDPRAELNPISTEFFDKHGIEVKPENKTVIMTKIFEERIDFIMKPCIISIGPYSESMIAVMTKLHYDVVLGEKWLHEHRDMMDCHTDTVEFWNTRRGYRMHIVQKGTTKQAFVKVHNKRLEVRITSFRCPTQTNEKPSQK